MQGVSSLTAERMHRCTTATEAVVTVLAGDDNPAFEGVFEFSSISAGGSIGTVHASCLMAWTLKPAN